MQDMLHAVSASVRLQGLFMRSIVVIEHKASSRDPSQITQLKPGLCRSWLQCLGLEQRPARDLGAQNLRACSVSWA